MAGEGSAFNMITTLKSNKALLRNKDYFLIKSEYLKTAKKINIDLTKASPGELKRIRKKLIAHNRKQKQKKILILLISIVAAPLLIWAAIVFGQWMFSDAPDLQIFKKESLDKIRS